MIRAVLSALLSHWRRQPFQLFTLIIGLSLATALWSGVQAINAEARKSYAEAAEVLGGGGLSELVSDTGAIPMARFVELRRAGWQVSPVIDGWLAADGGRVRVLGIDPFTMPRESTPGNTVQSVGIREFLSGKILAAPSTATRLRAVHGDRVIAVNDIAPGLALMDLTAAQSHLNQDDASRLLIASDQPLSRLPLSDVAPELRIEAPATAGDLGRLTDSFHLNLTAFGLLSFAVGLFIVNGAVGLAFEQRRPVLRTLRALGVASSLLVIVVGLELLLLALVSGALGIVLGYLMAAVLLPDVAATLSGIYGTSVEGTLSLAPIWWLSGLGVAVLGTAFASATGLVRVARLTPLAPAKPRAWAIATGRAMRHQLIIAGVCLSAAILAFASGDGLFAGFTLLGGLLLAAALVLPTLLSGFVTLAARNSSGPLTAWFWADTRQQLPGLSLALMALLLALAANIGVGTMVSSFRLTFTGWLDQRLVSDFYVSAESDEDISSLVEFLEPRVEKVLPIWDVKVDILGAPGEIYGVVDHAIYRENWPMLESTVDVWTRMAAGEGALVNEQLARREDLSPGEQILLPGGLNSEILGVYSDYGNPLGQVIVPLAVLTAHFPEADRRDFGVLLGTAHVDDLKAALIEEFGLPEKNMVDQATLKAFSLQIFERTFAVTGVLNILTLGVAGLAMLTSLLTLAGMRLPQLAPIWALGVTRAQLGRIELTRTLVLALLTFVLSIPVGIGLAWVLLTVINLEAFGWRLPMFLFPRDWLGLGILSIGAACAASIWPAWRLARRPPADLIRVFANER